MMNALQTRYALLEGKLHALSIRERAIIAAAVAALLFGVVDQLALRGMMQERAQLILDKNAFAQQMDAAHVRMDTLSKALSVDPNRRVRESVAALSASEQQVDAQIRQILDEMIDPVQMPLILGELLSDQSGLRLQRVQTYPAVRLMETGEQQQPGAAAVFRHDLKLTLKGSFFQMKNYLKSVEELPQRVMVDEVNYRIDQYPDGILVVSVHTLSPREELIRVVP